MYLFLPGREKPHQAQLTLKKDGASAFSLGDLEGPRDLFQAAAG